MKFRDAVRAATMEALEQDPSVFLIGVGITDPNAVWGTITGALEQFGKNRVIEGPLSENALTGICLGAATLGMRPVMIHHRIDFTLLALDQLFNHAAKWRAMFGGQQRVPLVIRAVVGRGWGNGPQHTSTHHALYSHMPGLKAVVPSNPYDAKGLLAAAIQDDDPVVYIEHRWFHEDDAPVPDGTVVVPLGLARVIKPGSDVTIVAVGPMVVEAVRASAALEAAGVRAEVIDLRTICPLDTDTVSRSVAKTGRLVVADSDWAPCGVAGEVIAHIAEHHLDALRAAPKRVTWPQTHVPSSSALEAQFYPGAKDVQNAVLQVCGLSKPDHDLANLTKDLRGPF